LKAKQVLTQKEYKQIFDMASEVKAPKCKEEAANDTKAKSLLWYLCYRYRKEHCEKFFSDPRFYKLFIAIYEDLKEKGHTFCPNRKGNKTRSNAKEAQKLTKA
jgi:hypothetical protein